MNNIYIDGSYCENTKIVGIGIYNSTTKYTLSLASDGNSPFEAEALALEECIRYCMYNDIVQTSRIFTDCLPLYNSRRQEVLSYGFKDFIWIPRELNTIADKLSSNYKKLRDNKKIDTDCVVKTSKITKVTRSLTKEEIVYFLSKYNSSSRRVLVSKLVNSDKRKAVYDYYFNNGKQIPKKHRTTFYHLIPVLLSSELKLKEKTVRTHLETLTVLGIETVLKQIN